jgi:hypothetical protein
VACLASGPSLTPEDVETVRQWRQAGDDRRVIVVNSTFRAAPWADALYAMDRRWWDLHWRDVAAEFQGVRYSSSAHAVNWGVVKLSCPAYGNSGAAAISVAAHKGATRVILLGYDCQHTGGRAHWHADHPSPLGNAATVDRWPAKFEQLKKSLRGVEVVNASRDTALRMFERVTLDEAMCEYC